MPPSLVPRLPLIAAAMATLVAAILAGLVRMGWDLPVPGLWTESHGAQRRRRMAMRIATRDESTRPSEPITTKAPNASSSPPVPARWTAVAYDPKLLRCFLGSRLRSGSRSP